MDAWTCLVSRASTPPAQLVEPAPRDGELEEILQTAMSVPDHALLHPIRFTVIRGEERLRLGDLFEQALLRREPAADAAAREKERGRPLRAPLIVALWASVVPDHPKTPAVEQIVTAGMGMQNVLNALHVRGYGAIVLTGKHAHDPFIKRALGLEDKDELVGFVYIGTPSNGVPGKPRGAVGAFIRHWDGAVA